MIAIRKPWILKKERTAKEMEVVEVIKSMVGI